MCGLGLFVLWPSTVDPGVLESWAWTRAGAGGGSRGAHPGVGKSSKMAHPRIHAQCLAGCIQRILRTGTSAFFKNVRFPAHRNDDSLDDQKTSPPCNHACNLSDIHLRGATPQGVPDLHEDLVVLLTGCACVSGPAVQTRGPWDPWMSGVTTAPLTG